MHMPNNIAYTFLAWRTVYSCNGSVVEFSKHISGPIAMSTIYSFAFSVFEGRGAGEILANFTQILPIRSNLRAKNNMSPCNGYFTIIIGNKRDESYVGNVHTGLITWVRPVIPDAFSLIYIVKSVLSYALHRARNKNVWLILLPAICIA